MSGEVGQKEEVLFGPQGILIDKLAQWHRNYGLLRAEYDRVKAEFEQAVNAMISERTALEATCTHKKLDGSCAWEGGFMMSTCTVCGACDL